MISILGCSALTANLLNSQRLAPHTNLPLSRRALSQASDRTLKVAMVPERSRKSGLTLAAFSLTATSLPVAV